MRREVSRKSHKNLQFDSYDSYVLLPLQSPLFQSDIPMSLQSSLTEPLPS